MAPGWLPDVSRMVPGRYQEGFRMVPGGLQDGSGMVPGRLSKMVPGWSHDGSGMLPGLAPGWLGARRDGWRPARSAQHRPEGNPVNYINSLAECRCWSWSACGPGPLEAWRWSPAQPQDEAAPNEEMPKMNRHKTARSTYTLSAREPGARERWSNHICDWLDSMGASQATHRVTT